MGKVTEKDLIATRMVYELPDAYDKIMKFKEMNALGAAVFASDPKTFDKFYDDIHVEDINNEKVEFEYSRHHFCIDRNGIIYEHMNSGYDRPVSKLDDIFTDALRAGLNHVEVSMIAEGRFSEEKNENILDVMIDNSKNEINKMPKMDKSDHEPLPDIIID